MARDETSTLSLERYAPDARAWVAAAQALADARRHPEVSPLHLLLTGLERDPAVAEVFRRAGADVVALGAAARRGLGVLPQAAEPAYLSQRLLDLLDRAERAARREHATEVRVAHVLAALGQEVRGPAAEVLSAFDIGPGSLDPHLAAVGRKAPTAAGAAAGYTHDLLAEARGADVDPVIGRGGELRRLVTILERRQKSHPLLVGEPGVGKGAVIRALATRLARGDVPTTLAAASLVELDLGPLLAGARLRGDVEGRLKALIDGLRPDAPTVLVIRGLDQLLFQGGSGSAVGDVLLSALDRGALRLLGTTTPEGLKRLAERDPALLRRLTVLPVEEPTTEQAIEILRGVLGRYEAHHGVHVSESAVRSAVALAKRYVPDRFLPDSALDLLDEAAAALRVETDGMPAAIDESTRRLESLEAQARALEGADDPVSLEVRRRLSAEADALRPDLAEQLRQLESRRGAVAAVRALDRELGEARARLEQARAARDPARAGELEHVTVPDLEKRLAAADQAARNVGATDQAAVLDEEHVAQTLALWTGIPVAKMLEGEADKLLKMEGRLEQRVVGQSEGVRALARAVRRGRVGLRDPKRPIGSFLFLGPSGVGKTELAKALAAFLFDDEQALTRLDMSEFMERHMAQRLLGAPPGYADSEQGGFLTEAVRRRPYSVLLFDEVEKAHQDVFNLLLQVLDDGRLTDGRGRLADFTNTVVIMTSNIGSERILETDAKLFESEEGREALRDVLLDELGKFFRPEFLNRVDDVIVFRPLSREHLGRIADIQLDHVRRLLEGRDVQLEVTPEAKQRLVELGYEPALGARPLRRAILRHIQDPLAEALLSGTSEAPRTLVARLEGDAIVLGGKAPGG
jgi:ATP-dependent Clp protease ATP-binding subunit ClpB